MRWIAGLVALVLTMALFNVLTAAAPLEARATLALGFLLLAASLAGELAARMELPRITGFLIAGIAAGPAGLHLVGADETRALRFFLDAAVALIAFAAGAEIKLVLLRRHGRALVRATTGALLFPLVAVAGFVLLASPWFPLTVNQSWGERLTIALALGALAAGASPIVMKALMHELDAHGPFSRLLLALTITKDIAVVLIVTLILALGSVIASSGSLDSRVLWRMPLVLVGSLGLGSALAWIVGRYVQMGAKNGTLILVGYAFVATELCRLLGLEVLLVSLAAGAAVANVMRAEGTYLLASLGRGAPLVYVTAFVLAGAGLHLEALAGVWPWVFALAGLRALALRYGLRWAGRDVSVPPNLAQYGWLGLIAHGGAALGLAVVVRRVFPEWGVSLEAFVLAMIVVHEVFGPALLRRALHRGGDQEARDAEPLGSDGVAVVSRVGM